MLDGAARERLVASLLGLRKLLLCVGGGGGGLCLGHGGYSRQGTGKQDCFQRFHSIFSGTDDYALQEVPLGTARA
jgi:hypothetical protein